jgi:flavin reductase (DIM6/NTAB) family NADH-FMN oxidoreductase RutF
MPDYAHLKSFVPQMAAGLVSWYAADGRPHAIVTSWVTLIGGERPQLRLAWYGRHDPRSRFWPGGDFIFNVPDDAERPRLRSLLRGGHLCLDVDADLGYRCQTGAAAKAPCLTECSVQIECVGGRMCDEGFDVNLCGEVVRFRRGELAVAPEEVTELCDLWPFSPL